MALTLHPLLDAREAGYGVGVLQAAEQEVGIYERIGFRVFGRITEYNILLTTTKPFQIGFSFHRKLYAIQTL